MAEDLPPVTFGIKVTNDTGPGGHVTVSVFAGRNEHARGNAGRLTLRPDEFKEFMTRLNPEVLTLPAHQDRPTGDPS